MEIKKINDNKKDFIDILLLGDEQESMIDTYLDRGELFALYDNGLKTVCVVTEENKMTYEIKNIATYSEFQGKGYASYMIGYIIEKYKNKCKTLLVGTGDDEKIISFYKKCGFEYSHIVKSFFINNYDHKIIENGKQLIDMIYLKIEFNKL
jgi:ribosomal protein S18 acetylase RimI-like enzyme